MQIAVDLEDHHYRSFMGFTCLMQISTRKEDFLVICSPNVVSQKPTFQNPNISPCLPFRVQSRNREELLSNRTFV